MQYRLWACILLILINCCFCHTYIVRFLILLSPCLHITVFNVETYVLKMFSCFSACLTLFYSEIRRGFLTSFRVALNLFNVTLTVELLAKFSTFDNTGSPVLLICSSYKGKSEKRGKICLTSARTL